MNAQKLIIFFNFMIFSITSFSQNVLFEKEIGSFTLASSFSINASEFIFVTDISTNEVYKLNLQGEIIKFIGGYGWNSSTFDHPVDVFANTLSVYVTDKNNDRIQYFDKDLNYLSELNSESLNSDYSFRYPTSAVVSPVGDLFVLDSDNSRILKFDMNGNFTTEIGSYDAGMFSLENPTKFDISQDSRLFVIDENKLKIFDQFGGGLNIIPIENGADNIHIQSNFLCIVYSNKISLLNLSDPTLGFNKLLLSELNDITDALIFRKKLFVLTSNSILIYKLVDE